MPRDKAVLLDTRRSQDHNKRPGTASRQTPGPSSLSASAADANGSDDRSESRRDHDRIFYSSEFARLEGITQVATVFSSGIHNRLTHSYRVEQVARSIVLRLNNQEHLIVDEDAVAAAALAHDIGHSPFGHTGEEALQHTLVCPIHRETEKNRPLAARHTAEYWRECDPQQPCILPDSFEGNAQSFRIITLLAPKSPIYTDFGLDLMRRTLQASLKYPWIKADNLKKENKWGAYDSDQAVLQWAMEGFSGPSHARTLEAQIMDTADDIAYAVHDLEDFYKARAIPLADVRVGSAVFRQVLDYVALDLDDDGSGVLSELNKEWRAWLNAKKTAADDDVADAEVNEALSGTLVEPPSLANYPLLQDLQDRLLRLPMAPYEDNIFGRGRLTKMRSSLISDFVGNLSTDGEGNLVFKDSNIANYMEFLKKLTWFFVISAPDFITIRRGQSRIIEMCLRELLSVAERELLQKTGGQVSLKNTDGVRGLDQRLIDYVNLGATRRGPYSDREVIARAVVDYLCSLTDAETYALSARLSGSAAFALPTSLAGLQA